MTDELTEYEIEQINNPKWAEAGRVHDWRNYISEELRAMWDTFTFQQKAAIYRSAVEDARGEDWD